MFANCQQSGFISIFFSVGSNPLAIWDKQVKNGHIRRVIDDEVKSLVLEVGGTNVATTYITSPIKPRASLGVTLPFLVMIIKNLKKYFTFEIQILDDKDMRRRFRISNFQSTTKVRPFCTTMPIGLAAGWNQVQFNLADFTKRAYGSMYMETVRVQIHANVRIRRIYFTDQLHSDEELPNEFKLFSPGPKGKAAKKSKEAIETVEQPTVKRSAEKLPEEEIPPPPSPAEEAAPAKEEQEAEPPKEEGEGTEAEGAEKGVEEGTEKPAPEGEGEAEAKEGQPQEGEAAAEAKETEEEEPKETTEEAETTEGAEVAEGAEQPAEATEGSPDAEEHKEQTEEAGAAEEPHEEEAKPAEDEDEGAKEEPPAEGAPEEGAAEAVAEPEAAAEPLPATEEAPSEVPAAEPEPEENA